MCPIPARPPEIIGPGRWELPLPGGLEPPDYITYNKAVLERINAAGALLQDIAVPRVNALPASPHDGDEADYLASADAGVIWRLRYRAAAEAAFKWEYVGGAPLSVGSGPNSLGPSQPWEANSWFFFPGELVIAPPLPGDYDLEIAANGSISTSGAFMWLGWVIATAPNWTYPDTAGAAVASIPTANFYQRLSLEQRLTGLTAGVPLSMAWRSNATTTFTRQAAYMALTPVRVG